MGSKRPQPSGSGSQGGQRALKRVWPREAALVAGVVGVTPTALSPVRGAASLAAYWPHACLWALCASWGSRTLPSPAITASYVSTVYWLGPAALVSAPRPFIPTKSLVTLSSMSGAQVRLRVMMRRRSGAELASRTLSREVGTRLGPSSAPGGSGVSSMLIVLFGLSVGGYPPFLPAPA